MNSLRNFQPNSPIWLISYTIFLMYTGQSMLTPLISLYSTSRGATPEFVGATFLAGWLIPAILSLPLGSLSDRVGRVKLIIVGGAVGSIGFALIGFASTPLAILLVYSGGALGHSAYGPATSAYPADVAESGRMARAIGTAVTSRQMAFSLGPALAGIVASLFGYTVAFLIAGSLIGAGTVFAALFLPERKPEFSANIPRGSVIRVIRDSIMAASVLALFSMQFAQLSFSSFVPIYASRLSIPIFTIGLILATQEAGNFISRPLSVAVTDKIGRRKEFVILSSVIVAVALATSTSFTMSVPLAILSLGLGFAVGFSTVIIGTTIAERAARETRGLAMAFFNVALYTAGGTGPAITGILVGRYNFGIAFKAAGAVAAIGAIVYFLLTRRSRVSSDRT